MVGTLYPAMDAKLMISGTRVNTVTTYMGNREFDDATLDKPVDTSSREFDSVFHLSHLVLSKVMGHFRVLSMHMDCSCHHFFVPM